MRELARPTDECAGASGYYAAQSAAWRAEVQRLLDQEPPEDPEKLKLIARYSIFFVVHEPGTLHFLTLDGAVPITGIGGAPNATPFPGFPDPTPTPRPTSTPYPIHPRGLDGCRNLSSFSSGSQELADYHRWCFQAVEGAVRSQCEGTDSSEEERACAEEYLAGWKDHQIRLFHSCSAISDHDVRRDCGYEVLEALIVSRRAIGQAWTQMLAATAVNPVVEKAHKNFIQCMSDRSFKDIPPELLFPWQTFKRYFGDPEAAIAWVEGFSPGEQTRMEKLSVPSDQCARKSGLYEAQEAAWLAEVRRLVQEDPEKAQPLLDWGILEDLEQPGIAPFLTKR